jgi:hypothetical protein
MNKATRIAHWLIARSVRRDGERLKREQDARIAELAGHIQRLLDDREARLAERRRLPIAPHPFDVRPIPPGSILDVSQADLDYAAGIIAWGGGIFSVTGLAVRLAAYTRKIREGEST